MGLQTLQARVVPMTVTVNQLMHESPLLLKLVLVLPRCAEPNVGPALFR